MTRLHIPAIPHAITSQLYSHCAFTGKVLRFAPMMRSRGYQAYRYGVEGSEAQADLSVDLLPRQEGSSSESTPTDSYTRKPTPRLL